MNYRLIGKYIGFILLVEGIFLLPAIVVSAAYREPQSARAIAIAAIITCCRAFCSLVFGVTARFR